MKVLDSIVAGLGGNVLDILVYGLIVLVFIIGLIKCILPVVKTRGLLRRAIRSIRGGANAEHSWQEDKFLGKGVLFSHWSEYLNNLFFADGVYHNASNVGDYINEDTVIYGPGRSSFADAVPGLLVSLGFLGTLIGLSQGLTGFDMSDSDKVMASIVTLIPGMRYAFMTSIFGVIGSLLFTLITRAIYGSTEHTLKDFYGAMSRYAGVLSVDPMTQIAIYQQEQTALIRTMAKDLNGQMTDNISQAMSKAIEPLDQSLRAFVAVNTKDQMRFLDAVVTRFIDRMDDTLSGNLRNLSKVLSDTAREQTSAMSSMRSGLSDSAQMLDSIREVTRIADDMVRSNAAYIDGLRQNQKQTDDAFMRVSSGIEQMDLVSRQQTNYLKTVSAMQTEITRSVDQMTGAVSSFTKRFAEESANSSAGLLKAAAELRATGAHLEDIHKGAAESLNRELKLTLDAYQDYVNQFTQRVDYLATGISDSLAKLPGAVDDTAERFLDEIDRMGAVLAQAQRALEEASRRLYADRPAR